MSEELGIRLGDAFRGVKSVSERQQLREACTDSLVREITRHHGVTHADVVEASERRNMAADIGAVLLPMLVLFLLLSRYAADRVRRSLVPDGKLIVVTATLLIAPAVTGIWLAVGSQWAWVVEMLRLRDDHLSYRAARIPWSRHAPELFGASVLLFLWIAWRRRNMEPPGTKRPAA